MTLQQLNVLTTRDSTLGQSIYCETTDCYILPEDFLSLFGDSDLTYDSLMANPNATDGWKNQFTAWREQGILN